MLQRKERFQPLQMYVLAFHLTFKLEIWETQNMTADLWYCFIQKHKFNINLCF